MVILQVLLLYSIEVGVLVLHLCSLSGGGELPGAEIMRVISWSGAGGGVGGRGALHQAPGPVKLREGGGRHGGLVAGVELLLKGGKVPGVGLRLASPSPRQVQSRRHLWHPSKPGQALGEHLPVGGAHALQDVSVLVTQVGHQLPLPLASRGTWREAGEADALADSLLEEVAWPDVGLGAK